MPCGAQQMSPGAYQEFHNLSQFLRYKRICTRKTDFIDHSKELTTHLLHKAYPIKVMNFTNIEANSNCARVCFDICLTLVRSH